MKILFISHYSWPHVGGVEKHVNKLVNMLNELNYEVKVVSENKSLKHPHVKLLGLVIIWFKIYKLRNLIARSELIHIHDVFLWYLPFRFIYPNKKVFITFHGGQDKWPVSFRDKLMVRIAAKLTKGNICVGDFIPNYFNIKADKIIYGAVDKKINKKQKKEKKSVTWLGRLDKNTDLPNFLKWLEDKKLNVTFVGDGELRYECKRYGKVTGFVKNPDKYLRKAETVVPVGYLSYLEAKNYGCKTKTFASTPIKRDYWRGIKRLTKIPTWNNIFKIYLELWKN